MGSCSGCLNRASHTQELVKDNIENNQKQKKILLAHEEIADKRNYVIGSSLPLIPNHPMANYIFPRTNPQIN